MNSLEMNSLEQLTRSSSSSVHLISSNDDLITEILLRLPAKSVVRSKLVSKKWLSLISDPNFVISHSRLNPKVISGLIFSCRYFFKLPPRYMFVSLNKDGDDKRYDLRFRFDPDAPGATCIVQSCNGLLLCSAVNYFRTVIKYYIINPTTKKFTTVPLPPRHQMAWDHFQLAFDPSRLPHYRVICVQSMYTIQIYSSETRAWKVSGNYDLDRFSVDFHNGVYWNGAIHWISRLGKSLRFDIDKECLQKLPMPPLPEDWETKNFKYFGESRGHLHLIGSKNHGSLQFIVFEMERDCSRWFVKYNLDLSGILTAFPAIIERQALRPSSVVTDYITIPSLIRGENENEEGTTLVMYFPGKAITYDPKDNTFKKLSDFPDSLRFTWYDAFEYIETLYSV